MSIWFQHREEKKRKWRSQKGLWVGPCGSYVAVGRKFCRYVEVEEAKLLARGYKRKQNYISMELSI